MECYSCSAISAFHFVINRRIDSPPESNEKVLSMCCRQDLMRDVDGSPMNFPATALTQSPEETLEQFMAMRTNAIAKGKWGGEAVAKDNKFSCYQCKEWRKAAWKFSDSIKHINLSIYPSPCQCRCCYCNVRNTRSYWGNKNNDEWRDSAYKKVFELLKLAKAQKLIAPPGVSSWFIAPGEITIHPYRKNFLDLVKGEKVVFTTNGFIFDKDIAKELADNPLARINISIDSGTAETWHKVKGVNNFNEVVENLRLYRKFSLNPEQITLKYIILPNFNDSNEDFTSLINLLKSLDIKNLTFSRDLHLAHLPKLRKKYSKGEVVDNAVIDSAARFLAACKFNDIKVDFHHLYTAKEKEKIVNLSNVILERFF